MSTGRQIGSRIAVECGGVKTWQERSGHEMLPLTMRKVHELMQAEIDELRAENARLRPALVGLIGADSEQELRQMEATMRLLPAPEEDKAVSINAIHALLATLPVNAKLSGAEGVRS